MAHLIDQAHKGVGAAYFGTQPAWHRLGTVVADREVYAQEALRLAKADYTVEEAPLFARVDTPFGQVEVESPSAKMTWRYDPETSQPQQLGVVGTDYRVTQPSDSFGFIDQVVDQKVPIESAGVLREGRSIFVTAYLPKDIVLDEGGLSDTVRMYIMFRDGFDGRTSLQGVITPIRTVCANTEAVALRTAKRSFVIKHTQGLDGRVQQAREALGIGFAYAEEFEPLAQELARTEITDKQWDRIAKQILMPVDGKPEDLTKAARTVREARLAELTATYKGELNKGVAGTAWGAWNAYTEYLDHRRPMIGGQDSDDRRALAVLEGRMDSAKSAAFHKIRALVTA